jgi:hypothetical protein
MALTATLLSKNLHSWALMQTLTRLTLPKSLEPRVYLSKKEKSSMRLSLMSKNGAKSSILPMKSLTQSFHIHLISDKLTDMTLPILLEIREPVAHAIPFPLLKSSNLVSNRNMDKKYLYYLLSNL